MGGGGVVEGELLKPLAEEREGGDAQRVRREPRRPVPSGWPVGWVARWRDQTATMPLRSVGS